MSATPSEEAMLIAEDWIEHSGMSYHGCGERGSSCGCGAPSRQNGLAIEIDSLVARRVEEERERCALVAGHFGNMQQRQDEEGIIAATAAYAVRDAIRIPPPPLPSKDTTPPRGEK